MSRCGANFEVDDAVGAEVAQDRGGGVFEAVDVVAELINIVGKERKETIESSMHQLVSTKYPPYTPNLLISTPTPSFSATGISTIGSTSPFPSPPPHPSLPFRLQTSLKHSREILPLRCACNYDSQSRSHVSLFPIFSFHLRVFRRGG